MRSWITKLIGILIFFGGSYLFFHYVTTPSEEQEDSSSELTDTVQHTDLKQLEQKAAQWKEREVSVYYVPHANDEVLTYGVSILNDLHEGKAVFVVLLSHNQKPTPLQVQETEKLKPLEETAGVKSFYQSSEALGITQEHRLVYEFQSGSDWKKQLQQVVISMEKIFPQITHHGISDEDIHPEHSLVGETLNELHDSDQIKQRTLFASVFMDTITQQADHAKRLELIQEEDGTKIDQALKAYPLWDPEHGWTACGYTSPDFALDAFSEKKYSLITTSS